MINYSQVPIDACAYLKSPSLPGMEYLAFLFFANKRYSVYRVYRSAIVHPQILILVFSRKS